MPKAYSYIRWSSPEQAHGDSFARQDRMAREYAAKHGLDLVEDMTFRDEGVSAYRGKHAATGALRTFLRAVEDGVVEPGDYLLVERLDRVSRQTPRKALRLIEEIVEAGVILVTLSNGKAWTVEALDGFDWIMASVELFRGNEESATKSHRNKEAWRSKRQRALESGERLTKWGPAWLAPEGDGWAVIPERAEIVRRIFREYLEGMGVEGIARRLNEDGVVPFTAERPGINTTSEKRKAKMWHRSYIRRLLDNPAVIGACPLYEKRGGKRVEIERVEGYFPAVIERETWEAVQALHFSRSPRRGMHAKRPLRNIFGGLLRCGRCGASVYRLAHGRPDGPGVYLVCRAAQSSAGCPGNPGGVRGGRAERILYVEAVRLFRFHADDLIREAPVSPVDLDEQVKQARLNVLALDGLVEEAAENIAMGLAPAGEARILASALEKAQEELRDLVERAEVSQGKTVQLRLRALRGALRSDPLNVEHVNALLRQTFSAITVDYDAHQFVLHWRHAAAESRVPYDTEGYGFVASPA